jgi:hypothetical protein
MLGRMNRAAKFLSQLGCLLAVLAPFLAFLLYPRAKWLFAFVLVGIAVLVLNHLFAKDPTPEDLADQIERLLTGHFGGYDVEDFEHQRIRDPQLKEFWHRSMAVGGLREEWVRLGEEQKQQLRAVIRELRELGEVHDAGKSKHE